jgi:hypothetical protein
VAWFTQHRKPGPEIFLDLFGDGPSQSTNLKAKLLYGMDKISSILRFLALKIAI